MVPNFTLLTCNCDDHPMLAMLHKPDPQLAADQQGKRSLVHLAAESRDQWLDGTVDEALQLVRPAPVEFFDQADALKTDRLLEEGASGQSALF